MNIAHHHGCRHRQGNPAGETHGRLSPASRVTVSPSQWQSRCRSGHSNARQSIRPSRFGNRSRSLRPRARPGVARHRSSRPTTNSWDASWMILVNSSSCTKRTKSAAARTSRISPRASGRRGRGAGMDTFMPSSTTGCHKVQAVSRQTPPQCASTRRPHPEKPEAPDEHGFKLETFRAAADDLAISAPAVIPGVLTPSGAPSIEVRVAGPCRQRLGFVEPKKVERPSFWNPAEA